MYDQEKLGVISKADIVDSKCVFNFNRALVLLPLSLCDTKNKRV